MGNLIYDGSFRANDEIIAIGKPAPDFTLQNDQGEDWTLSHHLGEVIAFLFYPKNETLVCTKQLCSIRDNWTDYLKTKATVVGISPGTVEEHQTFAARHRLPLSLLADEDRKITSLFGKHSWLPLSFTRAILVIDAKGLIRTKRVMFRGFRPTDYSVITAIHQARTDAFNDKFGEILKQHRGRLEDKKRSQIIR